MTSKALAFGALVGMAVCGSIAAAEEPYDITTCYSSKLTPIVKSETVTIMAIESHGIVQSHHDNKAFDNNTAHCVSVSKTMSGTSTSDGYCKYLDPDGDITVGRFSREGGNGTWEFVHGTGKWQGITGGGTFESAARGKPILPGTFQSCGHATGSFTVP